jgi:predicted  nucleic acid-binding Zn-ribbon protein
LASFVTFTVSTIFQRYQARRVAGCKKAGCKCFLRQQAKSRKRNNGGKTADREKPLISILDPHFGESFGSILVQL